MAGLQGRGLEAGGNSWHFPSMCLSWGCLVFLLLLHTQGLTRLQVLPMATCVNGVSPEGPKISFGKATEDNVKTAPRPEGHVETEEQLLV